MVFNYKLRIFVEPHPDAQLRDIYEDKVASHNFRSEGNKYPDSGFDIFTPEKKILENGEVNKIDFAIKASMVKITRNGLETPCGFYLFPRSSISKTKVRLANNVGIIDSGYRGNLCGMFDTVNYYPDEQIIVDKHTRLLQICTPTLEPFLIELVESADALGYTERGEGGFGSTGVAL